MKQFAAFAAIYGLLSGSVIIAIILSGIVLADHVSFTGSAWFGYLVMLSAFTFIFVGIKRYRDVDRGGVIGFGRALGLGLAITAVAGIIYVLVWEAYLAATNYAFIDDYVDGIRRAKQAGGMTGAALARAMAPLEAMRVNYADPLFRLPMTFIEIAPVGLVVALVSAALLRNPRFMPAR
ncbi:DUF4199 domain-containing protein [Sphingomonas sp. 28-63-12]|uniref:DUF4199 domain-containing protein n=1 Tax=Sphingomonas sp. 28-63-12 TaxID=1970434 RepID=UPI000BC8F805|nr:MAG: DUF4199 domain-containing protein [Sphingomonas sp. 28-63-12]